LIESEASRLGKQMNETLIENFDPKFLRPCIFPILADLGYGTSISINNGLTTGDFATEMNVSLSFFSESGELLGQKEKFKLSPGEIRKIDTRDDLNDLGITPDGRMLGIAHFTPSHLNSAVSSTFNRDEFLAHVSASDDFIEFRQEPKGVITGVAYQMGPQNDSRFNKTRTTLLQAPKVIVSEKVDTLFALINASTSFGYSDLATMEYWIVDPDGCKIVSGKIEVPAWTVRYISTRDVLKNDGLLEEFVAKGGMGMLLGLSRDSGLVPISMTRNLDTGAIACDHTLPPVYYYTTWGGQARLDANERLYETFFKIGFLPTNSVEV